MTPPIAGNQETIYSMAMPLVVNGTTRFYNVIYKAYYDEQIISNIVGPAVQKYCISSLLGRCFGMTTPSLKVIILTNLFRQAIVSAAKHITEITEDRVNAIAEEFLSNHPQIRDVLEGRYIQMAIGIAKEGFVSTCAFRLAKSHENTQLILGT